MDRSMLLSTMATNWLTVGGIVFLIRATITMAGVLFFYFRQSEQPGPKSFKGLVRFCLPRELWTHRCVRTDLWLTGLRALTRFWGMLPATAFIMAISPRIYHGLEALFGTQTQEPSGLATSVLLMLVVLVTRDFSDFYAHYLLHRWQWLWEFHAMHHSTMFMTPFSGKRTHIVEELFHMGISGLTLAVTVGLLAYVAGFPPGEITLFGIDAYLVGHLLTFNELQHSHVGLSFGRWERYLMSPAQHHVHHDRDGAVRNLGGLLAVWDRLFGTFAYSEKPGSFTIGLAPEVQHQYDSVVKLHLRPFQNCWMLAKNSAAARRLRIWKARLFVISGRKHDPALKDGYTQGVANQVP
jgi:sterol desaturase/sphingolipid hydroxylase (fatty acid hydroxylase superfamily)